MGSICRSDAYPTAQTTDINDSIFWDILDRLQYCGPVSQKNTTWRWWTCEYPQSGTNPSDVTHTSTQARDDQYTNSIFWSILDHMKYCGPVSQKNTSWRWWRCDYDKPQSGSRPVSPRTWSPSNSSTTGH